MPEIKNLIGQSSARALSVSNDPATAIDKEARTISLAFSSEVMCNRGWYWEQLDHSAGACDLTRLADSGPFLLDHEDRDAEAHIGVVTSCEISGDRRGRAQVRISKRAEADAVFQDIIDGIRPHVSVRYEIHDAREIGTQDGLPIYLVTKWTPLELSSVSVPADHSVGVGRSHQTNTPPSASTIMPDPAAPVTTPTQAPAPAAVTAPATAPVVNLEGERAAAVQAERVRISTIEKIGAKLGANELARQFVENGKTVEDFRSALIDRLEQNKAPTGKVTERGVNLGLSDKEAKSFSLVRAINALAHPKDGAAQEAAAYELDICRAAGDKRGAPVKGLFIPGDVMRHFMPADMARTMSTDSTGAGSPASTAGLSIARELMAGDLIDVLRSRSVLAGMGTVLTGLNGIIDIPRQTNEITAAFIAEDADATGNDVNFDMVSMTPKTVAGICDVTRRLLLQSSLDVEALVRREIGYGIAKRIDITSLYGSGTGANPRGVANQSGIASVTFAGAFPTFAELVAMETAIAAADADNGNLRYLINPVTRGYAKTTVKFASTNDRIWEPGDSINGYSTTVSNRVNKTVVSNNVTTTDVFFGNWAEIVIGFWSGLDLVVDPYTYSAKGRVRVVAHQDLDIAVKHGASFCLGKK